MKTRILQTLIALALGAGLHRATAQGTAFTYQGRLNDGVNPATGAYDLKFSLFDNVTLGSQLGSSVALAATGVTNGLFTVALDFGGNFPGAARWLEIGVRTNGSVSSHVTLSPRQELTPTPYAITAENIEPGTGLAGTYSGAVTFNNTANGFNGTFSGNGSGLTSVNAATLGGYGYCSLPCYWNLTGNAGTVAGLNFIGTTDNQALEFKVNGFRALRLEPGGLFPNVIAGSLNNRVIGGSATTISGGINNTNAGGSSTIGGGENNTIQSGAYASTIGGGSGNANTGAYATVTGGEKNSASGDATVCGGTFNIASGTGAFIGGGGNGGINILRGANNLATGFQSVIGGGFDNTSSGRGASVVGGEWNTASGDESFVGGGGTQGSGLPNNRAGGVNSVVVGGFQNTADGDNATIGGGYQNAVQSTSYRSTVGGGSGNNIQASAAYSTIGGGQQNMIRSNADNSVIAGGVFNIVQGEYGSIGGGYQNASVGVSSAVGGGAINYSIGSYDYIGGGLDNHCVGRGAAISGGATNSSWGDYDVIGGGQGNYCDGGVSGLCGEFPCPQGPAVIGGGLGNNAIAPYATIAGGESNYASLDLAAIGGGAYNVVSGYGGTVAGGQGNAAWGSYSMVPGGLSCIAAKDYCFAAGNRAKAYHSGAFVWADSSGFDFYSTTTNQFSARCVGGARFVSAINGSGVPTAGVQLASGGGSWSSLSDRNAKENFTPVDAQAILNHIAELPISTWNYKSQDHTIRHLGPMAQDFYTVFRVGEDEKHITTVDEGGVALAAIQGLNLKVEEKEVEIQNLKRQNSSLGERLSDLEQLVHTLTKTN